MDESSILLHNYQIIAEIIQSISILMGVGFVLGALFQFKKYGESRTQMSSQSSVAGPVAMLVAGAILLVLPKFIGAMLLGFFGSSSPEKYHGGPDGLGVGLIPIFMLARIVGIVSFIRGIVLLSRSGGQHNQPGTLGKALIHMVSGILCINIVGTLHLLGMLMGFSY